MSLVPRRPHRPIAPWSVAFMALGLAMAGAVDARVLAVRPDGTGDVPTIQAGVDALLTDPSESGDRPRSSPEPMAKTSRWNPPEGSTR